MRKLAVATADERFQLTTDGFQPYNYAVGMELDERVDYAQLVKIYMNPTPEEQRPYSPAHVVETKKTDIYGDPDFDLICTSHIERQNGSLRQWCKRLTRLTYAFSKKWENLKAALASLRVLQLLPCPQNLEDDARDGCLDYGSRVDTQRTACVIDYFLFASDSRRKTINCT